MKGVKHLFFDLDHTLWDYETNARITLSDMYEIFDLHYFFLDSDSFVKTFHHVNGELWHKYNRNEIGKEEVRKHRFKKILNKKTDNPELVEKLSAYFLDHCSKQPHLMEHAREILTYVSGKYELSIITNGFEDSQRAKLEASDISSYFKHVITSETVGHRKPDPRIFDHALELSQNLDSEVVMIGDNLNTDIAGAEAAGWKSIWYNYKKKSDSAGTLTVHSLSELKSVL